MNNPQFYIFGVPDGFDMYNATPAKETYFHTFYSNTILDKRKMVINRAADNSEISYVYLCYNILSREMRPGAFIGMSLTFSEGYYCTDISKVLGLFETIYSALSKNVILSPSEEGQQYFLISRFAERTPTIIKIEDYVEKQTRDWFGSCVEKMDETFRTDTQSEKLEDGLYFDTKSEHIIANLKAFSWVSLSDRKTDYTPSQKEASSQQQSEQPQVVRTRQAEESPQPPIEKTPLSNTQPPQNNDFGTPSMEEQWPFTKIASMIGEQGSSHNPGSTKKGTSAKKKNGWILGGGGVALFVAFLVFFFPKKEHTAHYNDDYGWGDYSAKLSSTIDSINTSINTIKENSIPSYSSDYSTNNYFKKASDILDKAKEEIESADSCLNAFNTVPEKDSLRVVDEEKKINGHIKEAMQELSSFENAWNQFQEDLKKQETQKKGTVDAKVKQGKEVGKKDEEKKKDNRAQSVPSEQTMDPTKWNIQVTGNTNPQKTSDGKYTWHVKSGTNNPVTITVTNNNKPVDVVWTWNDATVSIHSNNIQSGKTECRSIKVALRGGKIKGKIQFKLKDEEEFKYTVWLKTND